MNAEQAKRLLGLPTVADAEQIRAAYLAKVKEFPPERCGQEFQEIRRAYEVLKDPWKQVRAFCEAEPGGFSDLLESEPKRQFVGPQAWQEAMKRK
ncbi:J domain-containing protein [bacterium]|nr:J domain-containing protein [bacterium]